MKGIKWRVSTIVATILFSFYLLTPTVLKFTKGINVPKISKPSDPWYFGVLPSEVLKLGLDLRGGLHLVLGIDFKEVHRDAVGKIKTQFKEIAQQEKLTGFNFDTTQDNFITITFTNANDWKKLDKAINTDLGQFVDFDGLSGSTAKFRMTQLWESQVNERAVEQSLETLRNRIDEFGIAEPIIQKQGEEKILVQFPGLQDPGRLKEIISRTAKLSFQIERSGPEENGSPSEAEMDKWVSQFVAEKKITLSESQPITKHLQQFNTWLTGKIPSGTEILFQKKINVNTKESQYIPYLLERDALVTGEDLQDAHYSFDPETQQPIVNFELTSLGATKFEKATGENVGKYMAIVLDSNVHSAPRIKTKIGGGRAMIEMSSQGRSDAEVLNDAKDTSLVLRSGALPARLEFLEERVVGPSLGADSIRAGTYSLVAGLLLVFLFMGVYYKTSGLFANIALILNGLFILAILAAFEGTLTLPGLAGITLTLGMAVDANILILEHIREELKMGKSLATAVGEGYSRAFSAILDSNATTMVAGLVLLSFGYGPIRGFAVTLLIGLTASMYTAVFVTRVIFDYFVIVKGEKTISI
ncbi:MAG: protein translocase subunit SecD [Deltaproteobacteria bacterium]|nr:protein translocase subunit SecD [Deltaproteobacteria bacterium]